MLVLGLVDVPWWAILILLIITFLIYDCRDFDYFKKQGIPGPRPYPIVGTAYTLFTTSMADEELENLRRYGDRPCFGEFFGTIPGFVVFDEEMLSEIMVKQFSAFSNRLGAKSGTPVNDSMLLNLEDAHWKHVRNEMTPTFTTGKLKKMNIEINRCARTLADSILECAGESGEADVKEYAGGYTMDVIASTAFGIRVDSQKDRNNAFVEHAKRAFVINSASPLVILIIFFPKLTRFLVNMGLKINFFPPDILNFFTNVILQTMDMRKSDVDQSRSDFLQLMIKAQKGENIHDEGQEKDDEGKAVTVGTGLTTDEIVGNAMLFFIAGYDTTASALGFFLYNMALYSDIQEKLVQEINKVMGDKENVDTSMVQEMPYLEQCVNENLRLYPPAPKVNRRVNHDVTINGVYFRKDIMVSIPIFAIHRDPTKWQNPNKFDPDRFSPENRKNQNPYHFLPFGNGPRNGIGMRLALQELKVAIIHTLRKVKVSKCQRTQIPLVFDKGATLLKALGGIHLKVEPRKQP